MRERRDPPGRRRGDSADGQTVWDDQRLESRSAARLVSGTRATSLRAIVAALGGDIYAGGTRANVPYPGHSRADRSLSLWLTGERVVVTCFGDGDWKSALAHLRRLGLIDAENRPIDVPGGGCSAGPRAQVPTRPEKDEAVRRIWAGGRDIAGTLAAAHLRLRHIGRVLPGAEVARFNHETPLRVYDAVAQATRPALLLAIRGADGELTGLEVTYLRFGGHRDEGLRLSRKHIGRVPAGSAVRLDAAAGDMLVAEGAFTAWSASARFGLPAWALLSTRNLRGWIAPAGVRSVLIAGDNGPDGLRSAGILAARLEAQGVITRQAFPEAAFGDWSQVAKAEAVGAVAA